MLDEVTTGKPMLLMKLTQLVSLAHVRTKAWSQFLCALAFVRENTTAALSGRGETTMDSARVRTLGDPREVLVRPDFRMRRIDENDLVPVRLSVLCDKIAAKNFTVRVFSIRALLRNRLI